MTGVKCPYCKRERIWRKGFTPTLKGERQRYVCFTCGRTFYLPKDKVRKPRHLKKRGR